MNHRMLILALLAAALCAPAAHADSISYVKGGNVWLTTPDGARQHQVTTGGGYDFASQADDGTLIARYGRRLHRLSQSGTVLADFATPVSFDSGPNNSTFYGPFDPAISPDGTKVAYTYYWQYYYYDPTCNGGFGCTKQRLEGGMAYSHADRLTGWDEPGLGRQSGWLWPSWIGNAQVLLSDKTVTFGNEDVITDTMGDGNGTIQRWFSDTGSHGLKDGEMSAQRTKMAFVGTDPSSPDDGVNSDQIRVYRMTGQAPSVPQICFWFADSNGGLESPSWSPDGSRLVWSGPAGVEIGQVPDLSGGCAVPAQGGTVVIPGGRYPDWGPADVPAPPADPGTGDPGTGGETPGGQTPGGQTPGGQTPGGQTPGGQTPGGQTPGGQTPGDDNPVIPDGPGDDGGPVGPTFAVEAGKIRLRAALSKGLPVTVRGAGRGTVSLVAKLRGRKVASGRADTAGPGAVKARLRFTKAGKRKLRGKRAVKLVIVASFRPATGSAPRSTRVTAALRR